MKDFNKASVNCIHTYDIDYKNVLCLAGTYPRKP